MNPDVIFDDLIQINIRLTPSRFKDNRVTTVTFPGSRAVGYVYDDLGRITSRTSTNGTAYTSTYAYVTDATDTNKTSPLVKSITQGSGSNAMTFSYTYDTRGNILTATQNGTGVRYYYDRLGQLYRVNDPNDHAGGSSGTTWYYAYDRGGNMKYKKCWPITTENISTLGDPVQTITYTYGNNAWKDQMTKYNGVSITYDAIGNPTNDGTWTYTWIAGRQLRQMTKTGMTVKYSYDHNGMRSHKRVTQGGTEKLYTYRLNGKMITYLTISTTTSGNTTYQYLTFYYDGGLKHMRKFVLCLSLILSMVFSFTKCNAATLEETIKMKPDWLHGTLFIALLGTDSDEHIGRVPLDKYICAINFDTGCISSVRVPDDAVLTRNTLNGNPIIIFNEFRSSQRGNEAIVSEIRVTNRMTVIDTPHFVFHDSEMIRMLSYNDSAYNDMCNGKEYFVVLEYGSDQYGKAEVQLCQYTAEEDALLSKTVLESMSMDAGSYFQDSSCSVYSDKEINSVAWVPFEIYDEWDSESEIRPTNRIIAVRNDVRYILEDDSYTYTTAWLDDKNLIYTSMNPSSSDRYDIKIWDCVENRTENLSRQINFHLRSPATSITIDQNKDLVAFFTARSYPEYNSPELVIVSLDHHSSIQIDLFDQAKDYFDFFFDDNGIILYDGGNVKGAEIVWDT